MEKKCRLCGEIKDITEFSKRSDSKKSEIVWRTECKLCLHNKHKERLANSEELKRKKKEVTNLWREKNKQALKEKSREYHDKNKDKIKEMIHSYYLNNKDKIHEDAKRWREKNREKIQEYQKIWLANNKEKVTTNKREYKQNKLLNNSLYRVTERVRALLRTSIAARGFKKGTKTAALLGCTFEQLEAHLGGMKDEGYQLDHICPCAQAKTEDELIKLQHYTNLQWLSAEENNSKRDTVTILGIEKCRELLGREWIYE